MYVFTFVPCMHYSFAHGYALAYAGRRKKIITSIEILRSTILFDRQISKTNENKKYAEKCDIEVPHEFIC